MSIHKSLKRSSSMTKIRSVLTRPERLEKLKSEDRWDESKPVSGLPKTKVPRIVIGKKKAKAAKEEEAGGKGAAKGAAKAASKAAAPAAKAASKAAAKK